MAESQHFAEAAAEAEVQHNLQNPHNLQILADTKIIPINLLILRVILEMMAEMVTVRRQALTSGRRRTFARAPRPALQIVR